MELTQEYLDQKFENLHGFLGEHMATKTDLEELRSELASKEDINQVITAVDGIAKQMQTYNEEMPAIQQQLRDMKDWIMEAAKKIGVEYKG
jgi:hypothetical protein